VRLKAATRVGRRAHARNARGHAVPAKALDPAVIVAARRRPWRAARWRPWRAACSRPWRAAGRRGDLSTSKAVIERTNQPYGKRFPIFFGVGPGTVNQRETRAQERIDQAD
jgi:hypothetical protein